MNFYGFIKFYWKKLDRLNNKMCGVYGLAELMLEDDPKNKDLADLLSGLKDMKNVLSQMTEEGKVATREL